MSDNTRKPKLELLDIRSKLDELEQRYHGSDEVLGKGLLTMVNRISSPRHLMESAQLEQLVVLNNPEPPRVLTNYENLMGKYSSSYLRSDSDYEIVDIIRKYPFDNTIELYTMVLYDKVHDKYHVIQKMHAEKLVETYGFTYNNEVLDSKKIGDNIKKDEILYRSTSFDEAMNYSYGVNAKCMYLIENYTIEDAYLVSQSFADKFVSKEIEEVVIPLNDNDILINFYGEQKEYKSFPDVGDYVNKKIVAVKRRVKHSDALFDLNASNMNRINLGIDTPLYINSCGRVVDVEIYCNKGVDDIDGRYNSQIKKYYQYQTEYYQNVYSKLKAIKDSGEDCTDDFNALFKRAKDILDPDIKWQENNSVFNNMIIKITVEENSKITKGSKVCGRFGDKGVISAVLPDEQMPLLDDGTRCQVICNSLGIVNRLNPSQLYEVEINFICNRIREKMKTMDSLKDKRELLFKIIAYLNINQAKFMKEYYKKLSQQDKINFILDIEENGIYIHQPPFWNDVKLDVLAKIYDEFPWIEKYECTVFKHGRSIKMLKKVVAGEKYFLKLKHSPKSKFSARSTGHLNLRDLPEKSNNNKNNTSLYAKTPVRLLYSLAV